MNKLSYSILSIGLLLMAALFEGGCRHKELGDGLDPGVRVKVEFDWSKQTDADPKGMCVHFYNCETGEHLRFDFSGLQGGYVTLPAADWHVLTYNNDTEATQFGNDHLFDSHFATTRQGNILEGTFGNALPPRAEGTSEESVMITPDMIWGDNLERVAVRANERETIITLTPREMLCRYSYEIRNAKNLDHVSRMCAALSGMSGGMNLTTGELHSLSVTHPVNARRADATTIRGEFYTFGHHADNPDPHKMTLYIWMADGRKYVFGASDNPKWDVTEQIHSAPDQKNVHYIIDGLDLDAPMEGSLFDPSADDWKTEGYGIEI